MNLDREVIWETSFNWSDALNCLPEELADMFKALPEKEQLELIRKYEGTIAKGLEWGIFEYWTEVMEASITDLKYDLRMMDVEECKKEKKEL